MASASEIKARINGISETKKITDAMYMIASAKMRKAMADLERNTPYFEALRKKVGELILNLQGHSCLTCDYVLVVKWVNKGQALFITERQSLLICVVIHAFHKTDLCAVASGGFNF